MNANLDKATNQASHLQGFNLSQHQTSMQKYESELLIFRNIYRNPLELAALD